MKYLSKLLSMLLIGSMLWTVGCAKYDDEISDLNNKIENLESMMNDQMTPMETDLTAIKAQLTELISATDALTATHKADLATLTKANEDLGKRIKALEDVDHAQQIADAINVAVDALNKKDAAFESQLADIIVDVQKYAAQIAEAVKAIEELNGDVADLQTQDQKFVDQLATITQSISDHADMIATINDNLAQLQAKDEAIEQSLTSLSENISKVGEALAEYQLVVNAKINAIEARIETAEATLADIEKNVIPGLEAQIDANEAAIAQNTFSIQLILGILDVMGKADMTIQTLVETLGADVDVRLAEVNKTISEQYGLCWNEILRVEAQMTAKMDAQMLEIEALRKALATTDGDLAYLKATADKNYEQLAGNIAAVKAHLEDYKAVVTKEIETAVNGVVDVIKVDITELQNKLSDVNAKFNTLQYEFENFQNDINDRLTSIEEDLNAINNQLAAMVQNITFVPEYTDGLATAVRVLGGSKSSTLAATTLTAVFEITPASAASVIAKNGCVAVEPLKTRASILKGERLAVEVVDAEAGRVKVTAFVHNMPKDYNSYAFTLNVEVENKTVASSDYVYIHENDVPEYKYALVTEKDNKSIEKHANWSAERNALVFEKKWTKASDVAVSALDGYVYKLTNGQNFFTLAEIEKKFGMAEGALDVTLKAEISDAHAEFVSATNDAVIDMKYDNEFQMYDYINAEAEIDYFADNTFWNYTFKVYYKVTGVDVVNGEFIIEEEGDLYWLSQNQSYVFDEKKAKRVIFAEKLQLDMADYCNAKPILDPYKPISTPSGVSIEGNNSMVQNVVVSGENYVGLFGYVKGNISNLTLTKSSIEGNHHVGGIAGRVCGSIKNCHVDGVNVVAKPRKVNGEWDDGDKAGAIVGYSEPNSTNTPSESIENCSAKNSKIVAFRDLGGIVGAMNYGNDNIKSNVVENVNLVAVQRESQTPGYFQMNPNIGRILGRDVMQTQTWVESEYASNKVADADLRIQYAVGAEVNVNSFDASEHTLEISTANGLAWFSNHITDPNYYTYKNVVLAAEQIDFENKLYFAEDGVKFVGISNGTNGGWRLVNFNGMGCTIKNFTWDEDKKNIALFGSYNGDIKNINMKNVTLRGKGRIAPIAAQCWGHIDNCHVEDLKISVHQNSEDGDKLGGIVAQMQADGANSTNNMITNCSVKRADIEGYRDLGGLAGHADLKAYDNSNKFEDVIVWVNQTRADYEAGHYPFKNEHEVVGRITKDLGAVAPEEVEGVEIYNIIYSDLGRRYVNTPKKQLRLGYHTFDAKQNAAALWKFAEEYAQWGDVFQVTDMELDGAWTAIGTSAVPFKGTYNGNNKQIVGLKMVDYTATPSGFFGYARGIMTGINIINPSIYGCHYAGAVVAHMFGTVMNCKVIGGEVVLMPNYENGRFDNGDKAGALVGYLAATGVGTDKIINNTVDGVKVKAYRDVAALVGCANEIHDMSGNEVKNCSISVDQITGKYPANDVKETNIGMLIGRLTSADTSKIQNNVITNSVLGRMVSVDGGTITEEIELVEIGSIGK